MLSLRFLWLDRCQDLVTSTEAKEVEKDTTKPWPCFQSLWVLDLHYTNWDQILSAQMMDLMTQLMELNLMGAKCWDMSCLRGQLRNIRKLRITKSIFLNYDSSLLSEMELLDLLDLSGNDTTEGGTTSLSLCKRARIGDRLQTVIIHGSSGLINISFRGCAQLKNLFLSRLFSGLEELDLSETTLQTIDLSATELPNLKQLLLLRCQRLRSILWPPKGPNELAVLRIDTTTTSATVGKGEENNLAEVDFMRSSSQLIQGGGEAPDAHTYGGRALREQKERNFNAWRISLMDARLLMSLLPVEDYLTGSSSTHIDICPLATIGGRSTHTSMSSSKIDEQVQIEQHTSTMVNSNYRHVLKEAAPASSYDDYNDGPSPSAVMMMWNCPEIAVSFHAQTCIIEMVLYKQGNGLLDGAQSTGTRGFSLPDFISNRATSLHVYDNSSITCIPTTPEGSRWYRLRWCRVERCPKLHTVFDLQDNKEVVFYYITTFWASQLPTARYIWNWSSITMSHLHPRSFEDLEFLHLDYCPRLVHVLSWSIHMPPLRKLQTIEIVCCGDLAEVFPLHLTPNLPNTRVLEFPSLKRIHLHELPMLRHICGHNISAPMLETVKIRGCWSLSRLPALGDNTRRPKVDCEKEWWDGLEWDGLEAKHDPSLYEPSHSLYYKKAQLPRVSFLK